MKYINISIHDVTKSTLNQVKEIVRVLGEEGVKKITFLVVPYYHGKEKITEICDELIHLVGQNEVVLHGYTHLGLKFSRFSYKILFTGYEGEFVSFKDTSIRLKEGLRLFDGCKIKPSGFIPPAWLMRKKEFETLRNFDFKFTTDRRYVYDLQTGKRYFSPVITFSSRKPLQELSILYTICATRLTFGLKLLRVALHPPDINSKLKLRMILNIIRKNSHRKHTTLSDFIDEINLTKTK